MRPCDTPHPPRNRPESLLQRQQTGVSALLKPRSRLRGEEARLRAAGSRADERPPRCGGLDEGLG
ncbi:hypothetical protein GCM10007167_10860 [Vulcaniibacterium thermophilum]|uniref:Uncharacterized protein n=1 Tax=Vulcaniibacterium thermophilum TaxID=1169913 RepID=A0A919DBS0_9GAMM|nr:hypothetical protein GCM10007167_10860 [Vulcaniibacterium thermophilum]